MIGRNEGFTYIQYPCIKLLDVIRHEGEK